MIKRDSIYQEIRYMLNWGDHLYLELSSKSFSQCIRMEVIDFEIWSAEYKIQNETINKFKESKETTLSYRYFIASSNDSNYNKRYLEEVTIVRGIDITLFSGHCMKIIDKYGVIDHEERIKIIDPIRFMPYEFSKTYKVDYGKALYYTARIEGDKDEEFPNNFNEAIRMERKEGDIWSNIYSVDVNLLYQGINSTMYIHFKFFESLYYERNPNNFSFLEDRKIKIDNIKLKSNLNSFSEGDFKDYLILQ